MKVDNGQAVGIDHGAGPRSPHWETVKKEWFKEHGLNCDACDPSFYGKVGVQCHHRHAYHVCKLLGRPDGEVDKRNFRNLCETEKGKPAPNHHLVLGHEDDFQVNNEDLDSDIAKYKGQDGKAILQESIFAEKVKNRPKPFPQWTKEEKLAYRRMLDETMPPDPELLKRFNLTVTPIEELEKSL